MATTTRATTRSSRGVKRGSSRPAFDLTPSVPVSVERRDLALVVGDGGRWANAANLASQAPRFLLTPREATTIIGALENRVRSTWRAVARRAGVSTADCERIAGAFAYPGFRLPLAQPHDDKA